MPPTEVFLEVTDVGELFGVLTGGVLGEIEETQVFASLTEEES